MPLSTFVVGKFLAVEKEIEGIEKRSPQRSGGDVVGCQSSRVARELWEEELFDKIKWIKEYCPLNVNARLNSVSIASIRKECSLVMQDHKHLSKSDGAAVEVGPINSSFFGSNFARKKRFLKTNFPELGAPLLQNRKMTKRRAKKIKKIKETRKIKKINLKKTRKTKKTKKKKKIEVLQIEAL